MAIDIKEPAINAAATDLLGRFTYTEEQRDRWRSGALPALWLATYPELFDDDDLRITRNQPQNHFFEWLAALHIYQSTGWLSLVEKYQLPSHPRKQAIFFEIFGSAWREAISEYGVQLPDLFVYRNDRSDFFFCEVKGRNDRLRPSQAEYFARVEQLTGKPIRLVEYTELKEPLR